MSWKSVLLHRNDERRFGQLMDFSADFLRKFQPHLVGISVVPPPVYTGDIAGPPLLIDGRQPRAGERIVVAWNGRREAARATFDALPALKAASSVAVVSVGKGDPSDNSGPVALCAALRRHGVNCEAVEQEGSNESAGEVLLRCIGERKADLLVMGCYGHTRFREAILGGASRHILTNMAVPVLMSH